MMQNTKAFMTKNTRAIMIKNVGVICCFTFYKKQGKITGSIKGDKLLEILQRAGKNNKIYSRRYAV